MVMTRTDVGSLSIGSMIALQAALLVLWVPVASAQWVTKPPIPTPRKFSTAIVDSAERVHVIAGHSASGNDDSNLVATHEVYDPFSNVWSTAAPIQTPRQGAASALRANGELYVVGGADESESGFVGSVSVYDVSTDTWSERPALPVPVWRPQVAFGPDDRLYVIGGQAEADVGLGVLVQIFDPDTSSWTNGTTLPAPRWGGDAFRGSDDRIYVIGGQDGSAPGYDTVFVYDTLADSWSNGPSMLEGRQWYGGAATADGQKFFVLGGNSNGEDYLDECFVFDVPSQTWTELPPLNFARSGLNGAYTNGALHALGGVEATTDGGALAYGYHEKLTYPVVCGNGAADVDEQCDDGNMVDGDGCETSCTYSIVSEAVGAGGTASTDPGNVGPTPGRPLVAELTTPNAGSVSIATVAAPADSSGIQTFGFQFQIEAPAATAATPLVLVLAIDASIIPAGVDNDHITVTRDGVPLGLCSSPGVAEPDPCIQDINSAGDGDVELTILTSHASLWSFAASKLSKDEQGCVNAMNAAGVKTAKAQAKANEACLKASAQGNEPNAQACLTADASGKIGKAFTKIAGAETAKCTADTPSFGYTSSATVNAAAQAQGVDLVADLFGADLATSVLPASNESGSACQAAVLKSTQKAAVATAKSFLKCKKTGLARSTDPMTSSERLGACVSSLPYGASRKIEAIDDAIAGNCAGVPLATAFPGDCAADLDGECLARRIHCGLCVMFNSMDDLDVDCDRLDDGTVNSSCP
jgi:cysteine-rich repeat protein